MQLETLEDVAREASLWLDREYPGWEDKIDLYKFNVGDEGMCIGFYLGASWQELDMRFDTEVGMGTTYTDAFADDELTPYYREETLSRRAAKAATSA